MKRIIVCFATLFSFTHCFSQNPDCQAYKTGSFEIYNEVGLHTTIIRNDSTQTEFNVQSGKSAIFAIEWTSDCTYDLTYKSGDEEISDFFKAKKLHIEITSTDEDGYLFKAIMDGYSTPITGRVDVVKEM